MKSQVFPGITMVQGDLEDRDSLAAAMRGPRPPGSTRRVVVFFISTPCLASGGYAVDAEKEAFAGCALVDASKFAGRTLDLVGEECTGDDMAAALTKLRATSSGEKIVYKCAWFMRLFMMYFVRSIYEVAFPGVVLSLARCVQRLALTCARPTGKG